MKQAKHITLYTNTTNGLMARTLRGPALTIREIGLFGTFVIGSYFAYQF